MNERIEFALAVAIPIIVISPIVSYVAVGPIAIEVISVVVTSLLTLGLVLLYYQQYQVQSKQTKFIERDYESMLSIYPDKTAEEDEIILKVKNIGRGSVLRMYLHSKIVSDTGDIEITDGRTVLKDRDDRVEQLGSRAGMKEFAGEVKLQYYSEDNGECRKYPFKLISRIMSRSGLDSCALKLELEVVDEATIDSKYSYKLDLAEQDLEFKESKEVSSTDSDGKEINKVQHQSTTIEEGIKSVHSTGQDINKKSLEELSEEFPSIEYN